jgi:hypothetical protein
MKAVVNSMDREISQVGALLAHAGRVSGAEKVAALEIAEQILDAGHEARRNERIVSGVMQARTRAEILQKFRALLAFAESHGRITPAGRELYAMAKAAPPIQGRNITSPQAIAAFEWHKKNADTIRELIELL